MEAVLSRDVVGRAGELAAVSALVEAAAAGRGRALGLVGEPGIGKSRLRAEAERLAAERGVAVLSGRAVEGGPPEPYRPLAEALTRGFGASGPPRDREVLAVQATLAHVVPEWSSRPSPRTSALAIAEALLRLLHAAGREHGALLVVEDAHWADRDTVAVVEYLVDNADAHGAGCLLTLRPEPAGPALETARRLADRRAATLLELGRLARPDVDAMVRSCLGEDAVAEPLLEFIRERADGIPFFVEELLAGLARVGALVAGPDGWRVVSHRLASTVPRTLAESVEHRFTTLHPRSQEVLFAAALLGARVEWRLLPEVTGFDEPTVLASLREATYAQLLSAEGDGVRFRHALTRDRIVTLMLPPERTRLAARALTAVENTHPGVPDDWVDVAAELAELAEQPDRAAAHLLTGARRARNRGALATAAARLERAAALAASTSAQRLDIDEQLAQVRALAGDVDAALRLGTAALAARRARGDAPERTVDVQLALGQALLAAGRYSEANARAAGAAREAARLGDRPRRARATALRAQAAAAAGNVDSAADLARKALAEAVELPDVRCEAWEVLGRCHRIHDVGRAERDFREALEVAERHGLLFWRARALHELGTIDLLDTMRTDRLQAARRAAIEAGAPALAAVAEFHLASALVVRGRTALGREAAERAVAVARRLRLSVLPWALMILARSYAQEGRRPQAEAVGARARAASAGDPALEASLASHVEATLALHFADVDAARAALDRSAGLLRSCPAHHDPHRGLWALLRSLADDGAAAAREEAAAAPGSDTRYNRALLHAAEAVAAGRTGDPARAAAALERSVATLEGYEGSDRLVQLTRWLVAPAALRDGWGDPVVWLQGGVRWFAAHGFDELATSCRTLLRQAGGPVPRRGRGTATVPEHLRARGVTSREVDVLTLLADGLSNRQVADRLVLSPRTVEKHVASLLRKTDARDRDTLSRLLSG